VADAVIEVSIEIKGLRELDAALRALPEELQPQVVRPALTAAGQVWVDGMARRAPKAAQHRIMRRGSAFPYPLFTSIGMRVSLAKHQARLSVGPLQRAFWGRFQELGTRYQLPQPFMKPTLEGDGEKAIAAFAATAREKLDQVVRKLNPTGVRARA
jgi:HK97 gp10 family phage protein